MAVSFGTLGFGLVAVTGVTLFLIGTPAERAAALADGEPAPTAPQTSAAPPSAAPPSAAPPSAPAAKPSSVTSAGVTLTSLDVALPTSDRMFQGAGADAINNNCLACHSPGMVMNQPAMSRAAWQGEVNKMRNVFKAPVDEGDVPAIVDYLARTKGNG